MKKVVAILLVAVCLVGAALGYAVVSVNEKGVAVANFVYADKNVSEEISKEDLETIDEIFSGKIINPFVLPSCGFDDNISIVADGKTFCPANDYCAIIYYKERKGYFNLSENEQARLRALLEKYGFEFPCV